MRPTTTVVVAFALLAGAARGGAAETFEGLAKSARRVDGAGLTALFWSHLAPCEKIGNDLDRRQCLGLREARRAQLASETFVVAGGPGALHFGAYDARGRKIGLAIEACVACDGGIELDGKRRLVTGRGKRQVTGGALRTAPLGQASVALATQAEADAWKADLSRRVRSEFVIKVPRALERWHAGDLDGVGVEVVGFRVWDACDGTILAARPAAGRATGDPTLCPATAEVVAPKVAAPAAPAAPAEPERLSGPEVAQALAPVRAAAQACFDSYGVAGRAVLKFTFDAAGQITALTASGDFEGTPTGVCIAKAARTVVFPRSKRKSTTVSFPINVE